MLTMLLLLALQGQPAHVDLVAGTVVSERDQQPIAHATVTLFDETANSVVVSAYTDANGHYQLPPVAPGKYDLAAAAPGYITSTYLHHDPYSTAIITGAALDTSALNLTLTPAATLSGTIMDDSEPIESSSVRLFREDLTSADRITSYRTTEAANGVFEFPGLPPGRYYLAASGEPWYSVIPPGNSKENPARYRVSVDPALQVLYPTVYYPDTLDSNSATAIELHPGEQFTAHLRMHPEHPVAFVIHLPPDPAPKPASTRSRTQNAEEISERSSRADSVTLSQMVFGKEEFVATEFEEDEGTIIARGIVPGHYLVSQSGTETGPSTRVGELDLTGESTSLSLPAQESKATVSVTVRGFKRLAGSGEDTTVLLENLKQTLSNNGEASSNLDDQGEAVFVDLPPADYRFHANSLSRPNAAGPQGELHIESVTVNGRPAPDKQLHLTGRGKFTVVLTVTETRVTVQGVALREGKPAPGAMIVLVPIGPDAREDLFRRDQSDLDGSFNLFATEPGKYILVAIEDGWTLRWNDTAALAPYLSHGIPVSIPGTASGDFHLQTAVQCTPR